MRVVWISHSGDLFGGAERCLLEAVSGLIEKGIDVHTIVSSSGELAEHLKGLSVPVHIIPYTWWVAPDHWRRVDFKLKRLGRNLYFSRKLYSLLKRIKPDIVVSNTLTIPAGAFASKCAGILHIWYVHEIFGREGHGFYFDFGESVSLSLMNRLSTRVIVNSHAVMDNLKAHISLDKLRLVHSAVEVSAQLARLEQDSPTLRLIQVGNLSAGKRQEDAIRALAGLIKKDLKVHLTLVGLDRADYARTVRELARDLNVSQHVDFIAFTNNPFPHVAEADVALMCSRGEAFGRVTIEAMKLGKPVIGANSGGTAELISDGETGLIFQMGDAEDLQRKIETLYHDRALVRQMGRKAQEWARYNFSRENYTADLLKVFNDAMHNGSC